jgi:hypothetical protein
MPRRTTNINTVKTSTCPRSPLAVRTLAIVN